MMRLSWIALFCALLKTTCNSLSTLQIQDQGIRLGNPDDDLHQLQQQCVCVYFIKLNCSSIYLYSDPNICNIHP